MDFSELFNKVPETIVVLSPRNNYQILAATDAYLQVTMRRREDILGRAFLLEAFPDKDVPYEENPVKLSLDRALTTRQTDSLQVLRYDLEKPASEGGGYEMRYWEASHTPVLDAQGEVQYLIQRTADVTARELAKQAQKASEAKFKFVTDAVPQLVYTSEPGGAVTYVNKRWEDYTGIRCEESVGEGWRQAVHPEDLAAIDGRLQEALDHNQEFQAEIRIRNRQGGYRWFVTKSVPMQDEQGTVVMRVGSSTDIHSAKQMVQELLQSNEQMSQMADQVQLAFQKAEEERKTLERFFMQAPALFALLKGFELRFEMVNPPYQQLFPNRELVGKTMAEAIPEAVEQGFEKILQNVYQTGEVFVAEEIPFRADLRNKGQVEEAYFTTIFQPLIEDGKITGIIVFGYEVTERVKLRQQLEQMTSANNA